MSVISELRYSLTAQNLSTLRGWLLILINFPALWFFSLACRGWLIQRALSRDGAVEATARVVGFKKFSFESSGLNNSRNRYWLVLEFEDHQGKKVRFSPLFKEYGSDKLPELGTPIQITYSATNSEIAQVKDDTSGWENILIGLGSGVFFLILSFLVYWALGWFFIVGSESAGAP